MNTSVPKMFIALKMLPLRCDSIRPVDLHSFQREQNEADLYMGLPVPTWSRSYGIFQGHVHPRLTEIGPHP